MAKKSSHDKLKLKPAKKKSGKTGVLPKRETYESYENVEKVDFKKKRRESDGLSFLKRIRLIAIAAAAALLIGGAFFLYFGFRVTTVQVEGSTHYTADEIRSMVMVNRFCENSLYLKLYYINRKVENIPFVEQMDVYIRDRNTVKIIVYEKAIAGYVTYLENRMYFDKDGIFKEILSLTQLLNKKDLVADKIYFDNMNNITLYYGNVRVELGNGEHLQEQITHLKAILEKANPMHLSGKLHMENFTATDPRTTFEVDEK